MRKFFISFSIISIISIFLFILLNAFISFSWKFYNTKKYEKYDPFPEYIQKNFTLSLSDQRILHKNTHDLKYYFKAFVGPFPKNFKSKFVNTNNDTGRKTLNPPTCEKNIFLFGGSTTFGWLSIDDQTIASHLSKILNKKFKNNCVYNYGKPWFYSKQENNLLINLTENNKIPDYAVFLDGINEMCGGFTYEKNIRNQFAEINTQHRTEIFYAKIPALVKSLPIIHFYDRLVNNRIVSFDVLEENVKCNDEDFKKNFVNRLKLRKNICELYLIKCKSFLQPFGGIHGKIYPGSDELKSQFRKYDLFKSIDNSLITDISYSLNEDVEEFSYVDTVHYSSNANYLIAKEIVNKIF